MILWQISLIILAYCAQESTSLQTCNYYPDSLSGIVGMPTICADYCCTNKTPKTAQEACCGSQDLGLWWIAIGAAIALVVCILLLFCCCCGCCACKCLKCLFPCCD